MVLIPTLIHTMSKMFTHEAITNVSETTMNSDEKSWSPNLVNSCVMFDNLFLTLIGVGFFGDV